MVMAYRNDDEILRARVEEALEERGREIGFAGAARSIYAARVARAAAGGVAAVGGFVTLGAGVLEAARHHLWDASPEAGLLVGLLGGSWVAGALVYGPARIAAGLAFDRAARRVPELSENPRVDLVRLSRSSPRRLAHEKLDATEALSAGLPLAALGLLLPLSLHFLVWLLMSRGDHVERFGTWIQMSAALVGLGHVALAAAALVFGLKLREQATVQVSAFSARWGWLALAFAVVGAMMPGALLILIPPVVTAVTGILFIPLMFSAMGGRIRDERLRAAEALGPA